MDATQFMIDELEAQLEELYRHRLFARLQEELGCSADCITAKCAPDDEGQLRWRWQAWREDFGRRRALAHDLGDGLLEDELRACVPAGERSVDIWRPLVDAEG